MTDSTFGRFELLEWLARERNEAAIVISPGLGNYVIGALADHPLTLYSMDMPYTVPMALGMALAWPERTVIAIDGDGSFLAGPGVLSTIARYKPANLVVLIADNGAYLTTGSGRSETATSAGTDIEALARSSGVEHCYTARTLEEGIAALARAREGGGPWVIVAKVDRGDRAGAAAYGGIPYDVFESGMRFRRAALEARAGETG